MSQQKRDRFERLVMPHAEALYRFAHSLAKNSSAAEDLVQDSFVSAYKNFARFRVGTNCKAWLFKICKNLFIDGYRARKRRPVHQELGTVEVATMDASPDLTAQDGRPFLSQNIDNEELFLDLFGDEINHHLAELPEEFRRALLLCDLDGLSYEEISEIMDTPLGTVRSRISRGRGLLRERLEDYARDLGYLKQAHQDCDER
ncbi:MAG: sigma-70 family RNA polymerase sigma factor [Planctomycetota bacterium]